jgi:UDP-glucose 4-epimerase
MKILVTGSAGFMGSHLVDYLIKEGHQVWGIDNLSIGKKFNVSKEAEANFAQVDLRDKAQTAAVVAAIQPEICYHLAAWAHEGLSQFMPELITENNYNAFLNLIVPLINVGCKRVVVTSSMSVYGDQPVPFSEEMPTHPVDVYAVAKTSMEETIAILADVHGFDYTILRPHNVYGPRQAIWDPYRNVAGIFINRLLKNQSPIIYGDGLQTRAFSYIDDVTPYIAKAGFIDEAKSEIINIGPTQEYTVKYLAETVLKAFDSKLPLQHVPDRPREVKEAYCTADKAKKILGYETTTALEEGIKKMVDWARTIGPQQFQYLEHLELSGDKIPDTWKKQLL